MWTLLCACVVFFFFFDVVLDWCCACDGCNLLLQVLSLGGGRGDGLVSVVGSLLFFLVGMIMGFGGKGGDFLLFFIFIFLVMLSSWWGI